MAWFSLQTFPTCKPCCVSKSAGNFGRSPGHGNRQLNSISAYILGTETGGRRKAPQILCACKDASLMLTPKRRLRRKYWERLKGSNAGFCEGKGEWRCRNYSKRDPSITARGGQSAYKKSAEGEDSRDFNRGRADESLVRQGYGYDREVDGRSAGFIRDEIVHDDRIPMRRSTFLRYERDRGNYQTAAPASAKTSLYEEAAAAGFDRHNREDDIHQSSAPSTRDRNGLTTYNREELELTPGGDPAPASNALDGEGILDKRRPYSDNYREISGNFSSVDDPPERPKSTALRAEELWQTSNQRQLGSYLSNDRIDQRSSASVSVSGQGTEHGVTSIEDSGVTPVEGQWMPRAATPVDERDESQDRRFEMFRTSFDRDPDRFLYKEESTGGRRNSGRRQYRNAGEEKVLERGALYAKQVISQTTARNVGVVAQLSVDLDSLKVVALEVRPNLLFGKFHSIRLNSLSRIGDVILIHNESAVLEDLDLFNCYDLVGSDLFTESGFCLGKVRDYDFRLDDGAVLSLEFDTFGVPLIPSNVISTYSLTADEVIVAQEDGLLVRNGAEKRVRKLTKGLFSRPTQPLRRRQSPPPKERRKQLPQLPIPRSLADDTGATGRSLESIRSQSGVGEQGNDEVSQLTPSREPFLRERIYQENRKAPNTPSHSSSRYESSGQEFSPDYRLSAATEYVSGEQRNNYPALASDERERRTTDTSKLLGNKRTPNQPRSMRNSIPSTRLDSRGSTMS